MSEEITIYGDAADGRALGVGELYATAHDAATAYSINDNSTTLRIYQLFSTPEYQIYRSFPFFDVPILGNILAAKLVFRCYSISAARTFDIVAQNGQPTYPHNPLEVADYNKNNYSGDGGSLASSAISAGNDFEIELNETGLSWITQGQMLKLCLRTSRDINNDAPGTGEGNFEGLYVYSANEETQIWRPRLVITFDPPSLDGNPGFFLGDPNLAYGGKGFLLGSPAMQARYFGWLFGNPTMNAELKRYLAGNVATSYNGKPWFLLGSLDSYFGKGGYLQGNITAVPRIPKPISGAIFQRLSSVRKDL